MNIYPCPSEWEDRPFISDGDPDEQETNEYPTAFGLCPECGHDLNEDSHEVSDDCLECQKWCFKCGYEGGIYYDC